MSDTAIQISERARALPRGEQLWVIKAIADNLGVDELHTVIGDIIAIERDRELEEGHVAPLTHDEVFASIRAARSA